MIAMQAVETAKFEWLQSAGIDGFFVFAFGVGELKRAVETGGCRKVNHNCIGIAHRDGIYAVCYISAHGFHFHHGLPAHSLVAIHFLALGAATFHIIIHGVEPRGCIALYFQLIVNHFGGVFYLTFHSHIEVDFSGFISLKSHNHHTVGSRNESGAHIFYTVFHETHCGSGIGKREFTAIAHCITGTWHMLGYAKVAKRQKALRIVTLHLAAKAVGLGKIFLSKGLTHLRKVLMSLFVHPGLHRHTRP